MSELTIKVDPNNRQELIEASSMLENLALRITPAEPEFLGNLEGVDIFSNSELTLKQLNMLPLESRDKHFGPIIKPDTDIDTSGAEIEKKIPASEGGTGPEVDDGESGGNSAQDGGEVTGVDLAQAVTIDAKIPWDPRIHGGGKTKLAKAPHGWTLKRNLEKNSPGLLAQVEAELAAVMSASPEKPIETAAATTTGGPTPPADGPTPPADDPKPTPTPPAAPVKYLVQGAAYTADELKGFNSGWTDANIADLPVAEPEPETTTTTTAATENALTWPQMLAKITAAKAEGTITDADVIAACNAQGLESIQLAGARPDLQPLILAALFE